MDKLSTEHLGVPACPAMPYFTDTEIEMAYLALEEQADAFYFSLACN